MTPHKAKKKKSIRRQAKCKTLKSLWLKQQTKLARNISMCKSLDISFLQTLASHKEYL